MIALGSAHMAEAGAVTGTAWGEPSPHPVPPCKTDSAARTGEAASDSLTQAPDRAVLTEKCDYRVTSLSPGSSGQEQNP